MDVSGVAPVDQGERAPQAVRIGRVDDEMDVIGHQHPSPDFHAGLAAMPAEEIAVKRVVGVAEKRPRSAIAALRDVVRQSGNDDAG
jgi:hypothetical protein